MGNSPSSAKRRTATIRMKSEELPPKKTLTFRPLASTTPSDVTFSICTYNVLLQECISPERYPTIKNTEQVFDRTRRRNMLLNDIEQLKPHTDIFCLEEMCPDSYQDFQKVLGDDYSGHLVKRQMENPLHNAMFYNKTKLHLECHYDVNLHKALAKIEKIPEDLSTLQHLDFHAICNHFTFQKNSKDNHKKKHLLVMMAHFHYNPYHDVIKYAEMTGLLNELTTIYNHLHEQKEIPADDIYVAFAGDLNAQPSNQVYHLVMGQNPTMKSLEQETMVLPTWLQQRKSWLPLYQQLYDETDNTVFGDKKSFASAYSVYNALSGDDDGTEDGERGHPRYTNLTDGFTNTIDYIFYDSTRLIPTQLLELDTETYEKEEFLPSSYHASDHVILLAQFKCL